MKLFCNIPKNVFIVNESQIKQYLENINEAMDDAFSFDELDNIGSFANRVRYCKMHMGNPIGNGSSRTVFQIDDGKVLKLAKNQKGIAQNEAEADWGAQSYGVMPELFKVSDDYTYLVTEYVLPAKPQDFQHCLGMTFPKFCNFVCKCYYSYASNRQRLGINSSLTDEQFQELLENNEWLDSFYIYMSDFQPPLGDLLRIANYGMCQRDGDAQIVLLDSGLTENIWNDYYSKR